MFEHRALSVVNVIFYMYYIKHNVFIPPDKNQILRNSTVTGQVVFTCSVTGHCR